MQTCHDLVKDVEIAPDMSPVIQNFYVQERLAAARQSPEESKIVLGNRKKLKSCDGDTDIESHIPFTKRDSNSGGSAIAAATTPQRLSGEVARTSLDVLQEVDASSSWLPFERHGGAWGIVSPKSPFVFAFTTRAWDRMFRPVIPIDASTPNPLPIALSSLLHIKPANTSHPFSTSKTYSNEAAYAAAASQFFASLGEFSTGHAVLPLMVVDCKIFTEQHENERTHSSSSPTPSVSSSSNSGFVIQNCSIHAFPIYHSFEDVSIENTSKLPKVPSSTDPSSASASASASASFSPPPISTSPLHPPAFIAVLFTELMEKRLEREDAQSPRAVSVEHLMRIAVRY